MNAVFAPIPLFATYKPALQGLGYGKIDPVHKTSTTHSAITDQAGLSHINTDNFKQAEVQNQLNPIIANEFDGEKVLRELNAQTVITTEFGREAPKQIGDYAEDKRLELLSKGDVEEAKKWAEGGVYRVALHTAVGLLATGMVEGGPSASTTAYTIPKIDEYLKEQGFDETVRHSALLALSAGIGATVGGDTASTANNAGQTQWNYLSHKQLQDKIIELNACGFEKSCIAAVNEKYDGISRQNDVALHNSCRTISVDCINRMSVALDYVGEDKHLNLKTDIQQSRKRVLDVANGRGYHAISNLSMRADYFGAMYDYTGQPWFRMAEKHSRGQLKIADNTGFSDWISEAGDAIMKKGKPEFQYIYQNYQNETNSWSYKRLHNEQYDPALQKIHEKHYNSWLPVTQRYVDSQVGGEFLNPQHRFNTGCKDMLEVQECQK